MGIAHLLAHAVIMFQSPVTTATLTDYCTQPLQHVTTVTTQSACKYSTLGSVVCYKAAHVSVHKLTSSKISIVFLHHFKLVVFSVRFCSSTVNVTMPDSSIVSLYGSSSHVRVRHAVHVNATTVKCIIIKYKVSWLLFFFHML